jgi:dTDP-4-amino-4,6-dideoxygalactose transaminase
MVERVPFVDLRREHAAIATELRQAFERVVGSSAFILGEEVEAFEREFADHCGTRHCVGVASGTAALTLTLIAAGIDEGDEVIVPAHTYIATALAVLHAGATPVFCDVERDTATINADSAAAAIGDRTAAIVPVHLYGQVCEMGAISAVAARHGIAVIEDAAQAHGATSDGRRAGSLGLAGAFSFYPSKPLGALGDGGAICTDDDELALRARQLRNLGQKNKGEHVVAGFNERLDGLQAALLRAKLPHLDARNESRRSRATAYHEALGDAVMLLAERPSTPCVYHLFPVRSPERDELATRLAEAGVQTGIHYSPSVHRQLPIAERINGPVEAPGAEAWAAEELSLPMFPELSNAEIDRVAEACATALTT